MNDVDGSATKTPAPTVIAYHRLAAGHLQRWWRVLLGFVVVLILSAALLGIVIGVGYAIHEPRLDIRATERELAWELAVVSLAIAALIPAAMLSARWVDRRPAGTVASIAGHVRWRWLGTCGFASAAVALGGSALTLAVDTPPRGFGAVDWGLVALVAAVAFTLLPLQAAGEEYLFRGYLPQLVGSRLANPWVPAVALSLLFGLAHGTEQDAWTFAARAFFGLVAAWLTIRTGGLEAAIAMHAVGNTTGLTLLTIDGQFRAYLAGREPPLEPAGALLDMALVAAVAIGLERVGRRRLAAQMTA